VPSFMLTPRLTSAEPDQQIADGHHDQNDHRLAVGRQDYRADHSSHHKRDIEDHVVEHEDPALELVSDMGFAQGCRRRS
jgi:hypothetical protein